ncbi:MAG: hypothetical protein AAF961_00175, partial [Planctomycetota bacterium]
VVRHTTGARVNVGPNGGFENDGLVEITGGGTLVIGRDRSNGSVTGEEFRASSGVVSFNGAYDVKSTVANAAITFDTRAPAHTGHLDLNAGSIAVETQFEFETLDWTGGGFVSSPGQPILTGQGVIGDPDTKTLSTTLINRGELTWQDGGVSSAGTTAARLRNDGLFTTDLVESRNFTRLENRSRGVVRNVGADATISHLNNLGTLDVVASTFTLAGTVDNHGGTTLSGGEWIVRDGATIDMGAKQITVNDAAVRLFGARAQFDAIDPLAENRGLFQIAEGRDFTTVGPLINTGALIVGDGSSLVVDGTYTQTGANSSLQVNGEFRSTAIGAAAVFQSASRLRGVGTVRTRVAVRSFGIIAPGFSPGTLTVDALEFGDDAIYEWEYDGVESDSVVVLEDFTMGATATLQVDQLVGAPDPLAEFTLFSYPESIPDPTNPDWTIVAPSAPGWDVSAIEIFVDEVGNRVVMTGLSALPNSADFDSDGAVDGKDYAIWQDNFGASGIQPGERGDADRNGATDGADFLIWQREFGWRLGEPRASGVSRATIVPEPSACGIMAIFSLAPCLAPWTKRRNQALQRRQASD